ncbi:hypothetical protein HP401_21630 [Brevibacillus sp. HB2.2]|nr:hypothetical protein [Brevibacillus sp. HB2.2]
MIITLIDNDHKKHILIDGGVFETYHNQLKERLKIMADRHEEISLLVVTHIDQDHIEGVIEVLKDQLHLDKQKRLRINEVWHNSFRHLHFSKVDNTGVIEKTILKGIIAAAKNKRCVNYKCENNEISARQGSTLAALLKAGGYSWNSSFNGNAINYDYLRTVKFEGFKIRLLSPDTQKLMRLSKVWEKELNKKKFGFKISDDVLFEDAFEFSMFMQNESNDLNQNQPIAKNAIRIEELINEDEILDTSPTNGSSIAFILEYAGRKLLFLGDSHPEIVADHLEKLKEEHYELRFDLVKISHHGSKKNTNDRLLSLIDSFQYLISTDGKKHNHPDLVTLSKLLCRPSTYTKKVIFNYYTDNAKRFQNSELMDKYNYSFEFPRQEGSPVMIELREVD